MGQGSDSIIAKRAGDTQIIASSQWPLVYFLRKMDLQGTMASEKQNDLLDQCVLSQRKKYGVSMVAKSSPICLFGFPSFFKLQQIFKSQVLWLAVLILEIKWWNACHRVRYTCKEKRREEITIAGLYVGCSSACNPAEWWRHVGKTHVHLCNVFMFSDTGH